MTDPDLPDTAVFWRWVSTSIRHYLGWILVAVGALAIILGYIGVANEALVAKQLPYIISGGILGLALVGFGSYYLVTEELRSDSGRLDRLERMVTELHSVLLSRPDAPDAPVMASSAATSTDIELVALRDSERFHRSDCRMVAGKPDVVAVTAAAIRSQKLQPCGLCDPVLSPSG
jgi:hypothetical protein